MKQNNLCDIISKKEKKYEIDKMIHLYNNLLLIYNDDNDIEFVNYLLHTLEELEAESKELSKQLGDIKMEDFSYV